MLHTQQDLVRAAQPAASGTRICSAVHCIAVAGVLVFFAGGLVGCQKTLFGAAHERSQFEQYDRTHGAYVPPTMTDRNGHVRPALRERLRTPSG